MLCITINLAEPIRASVLNVVRSTARSILIGFDSEWKHSYYMRLFIRAFTQNKQIPCRC